MTPAGPQGDAGHAATVAALRALAAAERAYLDAVAQADKRRTADRNASTARKQAMVKQADGSAKARKDTIQQLTVQADQMWAEAERALRDAMIRPQPGAGSVVGSARPGEAEAELVQAYNTLVKAHSNLDTSLRELQRVRGTLVVRALRKVGLPPL